MTDNLDSIQSLLQQVHDGHDAVIPTEAEISAKEAEEAERIKNAVLKFKQEVLSDPKILKRVKKYRREGIYAIKPWQWTAIIVGAPIFLAMLVYFIHLFSNVTRSNMAMRDGLKLIYSRHPDEALPLMNKAIELGSEPAVTFLRFGMALADMEYTDSAIQLLDSSMKMAIEKRDMTTMALAASKSAELFLGEKKHEEALSRLKAVLDLAPRERNALLIYGRILIEQSRYEDAEKAFIASIERNPNSLMPRWYLRQAYQLQGKTVEAREQEDYLLMARPAGDENFETLTGYAELLVNYGRGDEAEKILMKLLASTLKPMPDVMVTLGYLSLEKQDYAAARTFADSSIAIAPWFANSYVLRSVINYHDGNGRDAIRDVDKALSLDPLNAYALYTKGSILLYDLGMYSEALRYLYRAEKSGYDGMFLYYNLGAAEYYTKNSKSAILNYDKLAPFMKGNIDIQYARANAYLLDRQLDTAQKIYDKLFSEQTRNVTLMNNIALINELKGDTVAALNLYWKASQTARRLEDADTVALKNIARIINGEVVNDIWSAMHSEIVMRPRGVADPFSMKKRMR